MSVRHEHALGRAALSDLMDIDTHRLPTPTTQKNGVTLVTAIVIKDWAETLDRKENVC